MSSNSKFDYVAEISALSEEQRIQYYETFSHNLTVANRIIVSDEDRADADKVRGVRCINELLHHVFSMATDLRRNLAWRSETDIWDTIQLWVGEDPSIAGTVGWAITSSFETVTASN